MFFVSPRGYSYWWNTAHNERLQFHVRHFMLSPLLNSANSGEIPFFIPICSNHEPYQGIHPLSVDQRHCDLPSALAIILQGSDLCLKALYQHCLFIHSLSQLGVILPPSLQISRLRIPHVRARYPMQCAFIYFISLILCVKEH